MAESYQEIADRCLKEFQAKEPEKGYWVCTPVKDKPNHFALLGSSNALKEVRWEPDYQTFATVSDGKKSHAAPKESDVPPVVEEKKAETPPAEPPAQPQVLRVEVYNAPESKDSKFDGTVAGYVGYSILSCILTVCTLSLAYPWMHCMIKRWETRHTIIGGRRLRFDGTGGQLIGHWILWLILFVVTLGIYGFWIPIRVMQWTTKHTHFDM